MADYTNQIKQLTRQANANQPSMPAPSNSLTADIVNAVGMGVKLWKQDKAETQIAALNEQQQLFDTEANKAALGLRELRLTAQANGVSPSDYLAMETEYLSGLSPDMRSAAISGSRKMTGASSFSVMGDLEKSELSKQGARQTLELEAVQAANEAGIYVDPKSMSDQDLHEVKLRAAAEQGAYTRELNAINIQMKRAEGKEAREKLQDRAFSVSAGRNFTNELTVEVSQLVSNMGGLSPATAPDIVSMLSAKKATLRNQFQSRYVRLAEENGIYVSRDTVNQAIADAEASIDAMVGALQNTDTLTAIQNNTAVLFEGSILKALNDKDPNTKTAAFKMLSANYAKQPTLLANFAEMSEYLGEAVAGKYNPSLSNTALKEVLTPLDPNKAMDHYPFVSDVLESIFNGTSKNVKAAVSGGANSTVTEVLAKTGDSIVDPANASEHADNLMRANSKVITATIAKLVTEKANPTGASNLYTTSPTPSSRTHNLSFEGGLLRLVPTTTSPVNKPSKAVGQFNAYVKNTVEALRKLGKSEEEIQAFQEDIALGFGLAPTNED